jgi:hypothetical protein
MPFRCAPRLLFLAVALLFAVGHAHQVLGRFEAHHHDSVEEHAVGDLHDHDGGEHHEDGGDSEKDSDHMKMDHATVADVPAQIVSMVVALHSVERVDLSADAMPEAPVAGIDYPPQLGG